MNAPEIQITDRRELIIEQSGASASWRVTEFDGGHSYMLVASGVAGSLQFSAQFDAEQWVCFVGLIVGEVQS